MKLRRWKRETALLLTLIMLLGLQPRVSAVTRESPFAEYPELVLALESRRNALNGGADSREAADACLDMLTPTELVYYYAEVSEDYYAEHYTDISFRFFDASLYLAKNPEIAALARESGRDRMEFALAHYFEEGIRIGRASRTEFDPVIAILLFPDSAREALAKRDFTPESLFRAYTEKSGREDTLGYLTLYHRAADGKITLYLVRGQAQKPANPRSAEFRNGLAGTISPYRLWVSDSGQTEQVELDGVYYGENYAKIKDKLKDDYTLMIYICASNQENYGYYRQTVQLMEMVAAENNNVNILICAGGCDDSSFLRWKNNHFRDINNGMAGIYYLDSTAISSEVREKIRETGELDSDEDLYKLAVSAKSGLGDILMDEVLNAETLVPLVHTGPVDFGKPELLLSFLDFAAELFPAGDYGLILSDHGGGITGGVCVSGEVSDLETSALEPGELESALGSSKIFTEASPDGKLGLLFMDACLMSSGELAYSLGDYYRYLVASEEITCSYTDYLKLIAAVNSYAAGADTDDRALSVGIARGFQSSSWHQGYTFASSMAVCASEYIDGFTEKINAAAAALNELLCSDTISDQSKKENFDAIYLALCSCYPYYGLSDEDSITAIIDAQIGTVDAGEFLYYLEKELSERKAADRSGENDDANTKLLDAALARIGEAMDCGTLVFSSMNFEKGLQAVLAESETGYLPIGETGPGAESFWNDYRGTDTPAYGLSLYLPRWNRSGETESSYLRGYENSALSDYVRFVNTMAAFEASGGPAGEASSALRLEIAGCGDKPGYPYSDFTKGAEIVKTEGDRQFLKIELPEAYEPGTGYENSFGSPMEDFLVLAPHMELALTHKAETGGNSYDMVCGILTVPPFALSPDTCSLNIWESDILEKEYLAVYEFNDDESGRGHAQFISLSDAENDSEKKSTIIQALFPDSYLGPWHYYTVLGVREEYSEESRENVRSFVYHVFDFGCAYLGTVAFSEEKWEAESLGTLGELRFCHTCVDESEDGTCELGIAERRGEIPLGESFGSIARLGTEPLQELIPEAELSEFGYLLLLDSAVSGKIEKPDEEKYDTAALLTPAADRAEEEFNMDELRNSESVVNNGKLTETTEETERRDTEENEFNLHEEVLPAA